MSNRKNSTQRTGFRKCRTQKQKADVQAGLLELELVGILWPSDNPTGAAEIQSVHLDGDSGLLALIERFREIACVDAPRAPACGTGAFASKDDPFN